MKSSIKFIISILSISAVFFVSCKKENPATPIYNLPPPPPPPPPPLPPAITKLQLIEFGNLSKPRYHLLATTAGNKMLFVGGRYFVPNAFYDSTDNVWWNGEYTSSRVDIYDTSTQIWSVHELDGSSYSSWSGMATVGNKIFFAGGYHYNTTDSARVDIYDAASNSWSFITLPMARREMAVASLGNKIFFAGNGATFDDSGKVDIYDVSNNNWSTATLSQPRTLISVVSFANRIFFAGGFPLTTRVDIYDGTTQSWSTSELNTAKYLMKAVKAGNKLLFDSGDQNLNTVDIYNDSTRAWSSTSFGVPGAARFQLAASVGDSAIIFDNSNRAIIYNGVNNIWTILPTTPSNSYGNKTAITAGNQIYLAGGLLGGQTNSDKVWKIQF